MFFATTKVNTSIEKEKQILHYLFCFFNENIGKNKNIPTGDIEVEVSELEIINRAETTPMIVAEDTLSLIHI